MAGLEKLNGLKETGDYVFHGSPEKDIQEFEPRQGTHIPDFSKPNESILDGNPAISATPYPELAAFRAVINGKNIPFPHTSGFGITDDKPVYRVSHQEVLDAAQDKTGHVYVFNKQDFEPYHRDRNENKDTMEWRSYNPVKPVDVVEVNSEDLPPREEIAITDHKPE